MKTIRCLQIAVWPVFLFVCALSAQSSEPPKPPDFNLLTFEPPVKTNANTPVDFDVFGGGLWSVKDLPTLTPSRSQSRTNTPNRLQSQTNTSLASVNPCDTPPSTLVCPMTNCKCGCARTGICICAPAKTKPTATKNTTTSKSAYRAPAYRATATTATRAVARRVPQGWTCGPNGCYPNLETPAPSVTVYPNYATTTPVYSYYGGCSGSSCSGVMGCSGSNGYGVVYSGGGYGGPVRRMISGGGPIRRIVSRLFGGGCG